MAVQTWLLRGSDGAVQQLDPEGAAARLSRAGESDGSMLWLDLADPGPDELQMLRDRMNLHPLALEDVEKRRQRPKIDTYSDQYLVVAYETLPASDSASYGLGEIHLVAARGVLVTAHWGPSASIEQVRGRFERGVPGLRDSVASLLHALLDEIADGYFPVIDRLSDIIDDLESRIVAGERERDALRDVLRVKRELLELRRVTAPFRDVANSLLRRELEILDPASLPYFQDLYDHLVRVLDSVDLYRDILASALDANLAIASNNLNLVVKRLTALTVIIMLPTLIAGMYGMNFRGMPELDWQLGYPYALVLMAVTAVGAIWFFHWRDWL